MCVYGLLSFVITSFEEESLQVCTLTLHVLILTDLFITCGDNLLSYDVYYRLMVWRLRAPTLSMLPVRSFLLQVWLKSFGNWWEKHTEENLLLKIKWNYKC